LLLEAILITVVTASTPLLIAALGELVVERSGVLNLGVEGMMVMGASCGFAAAVLTGSSLIGALAGIVAGMALAAAFGLMTLGFAANQVASGLALTILGLGLSGLIGNRFTGVQRDPAPKLHIPGLSDLPFVGPVIFGHDGFVYASFALLIGVSWFLWRTRAGLTLRGIGDNPVSAHSLGHKVLIVRFLAILFGGGCGWIALALVVFASWVPWRVAVGAYLFGAVSILQLHAQALGLGIPSQLMTSLPYLATVLVLVITSRVRGRGASPASLGTPFVPDR
jgi:simple sugar transport system permease protein